MIQLLNSSLILRRVLSNICVTVVPCILVTNCGDSLVTVIYD